jgi:O-antigen/teichoic acid export membrane protein
MQRIKNFLFSNINQKQTIFKNTFWLATSDVIMKLAKFFLVIFIIRSLGVTEYGKFSFAISFVSIFVIFIDFGISSILTREFAKDQKQEEKFSALLSLRLILGIATILLVNLGSFFITQDPTVKRIILILSFYIFLAEFSGIFFCFFKARQKMEYEAWIKIIQTIILTGAGFGILFIFPSIIALSYAYALSAVFALIITLIFFYTKIARLKFTYSKTVWKEFLINSWPIALIGIISSVYNSTDSVMMGYFGQITQTGYYNAAYKIIGVSLLPMNLIIQSFYPALSSKIKEKEKYQKIWNTQFQIMIFLATPLLVAGLILAPKIIQFLYGSEFLVAVFTFRILLIGTFFLYLYIPYRETLIIFNLQKKLFKIVLSGAIINIVLNYFLIPKYSLDGASVATTITHLFVLISLVILTAKHTYTSLDKFANFKFAITSLMASFIMGCFLVLNLKLHIIPLILIGSIIYLVIFAAFNAKQLIKKYAIKK